MVDDTATPNHHRDYPGFSGIGGLVAAVSMLGRTDDARTAARLGALDPADTVVDIGCGPGTAARHAARSGATVVGVDPAPVMLRVARVLSPGSRARYREGSAEALPLPDDAATLVWSIASVHHWRDVDRALDEIRRVLRPAGRFVAIERSTRPGATGHASHGWTDDQAAAFAQRCTARGLIDVRVEHAATGRRALVAVTSRRPDR